MPEGEQPPNPSRRALIKGATIGIPSLVVGAILDRAMGSEQQKSISPYEKAEAFLRSETTLLSATVQSLDMLTAAADTEPSGDRNPQTLALKSAYGDYQSRDVKVTTWNNLIEAAMPEHKPVSNSNDIFTVLAQDIWRARYQEKAKALKLDEFPGSSNFMLVVQRPRNVDGSGGTVTDVVIVPDPRIESDNALVLRHETLVAALATPNGQAPALTEKLNLSTWLTPKLRLEPITFPTPLPPTS